MYRMMDETAPVIDVFTYKRWQELTTWLSSMRTAENSDIILTCANKEFYAHKLVLESSSPYFVTMFRCGLEETKAGKVCFQHMDPEALAVILDFLYLGQVDNINTVEQLKKVLESSHLMQLELLKEYCCNAFLEKLSLENFVDVWNIADKFGSVEMLKKLFNFLCVSFNKVLDSPLFPSLSFDQLISYFSFASEIVSLDDEYLRAIVVWLRNDLFERAKYAKKLFKHVDTKTLSKTTIKDLLEDEELINSSDEINYGLKDIAVAVAYFTSNGRSIAAQLETLISTKLGQMRIVFHSEFQIYHEYSTIKTALLNRVQEFDPSTMRWLQSSSVVRDACATALIGQSYMTLQKEELSTITKSYQIANFLFYVNNPFQFRDYQKNTWVKLQKPNCVPPFQKVLRSSKYLYIVGSAESSGDLIIEYGNVNLLNDIEWFILPSPQIPKEIQTNFFIYKNKMYGFYYTKGELRRIMFDHKLGKWLNKILPIGPPGITDVVCVHKGCSDECIVFVSTAFETPQIPNFIWDPESGKWTRLPLPKGKCELQDQSKLYKLYAIKS